MKTFAHFIAEDNASDYSSSPDVQGEDFLIPGNTMVAPGSLPSGIPPQDGVVDAKKLDEVLEKRGDKWAIVSPKTGKPLRYFHGPGKPSEEWVMKATKSIEFWKTHAP